MRSGYHICLWAGFFCSLSGLSSLSRLSSVLKQEAQFPLYSARMTRSCFLYSHLQYDFHPTIDKVARKAETVVPNKVKA